MKGNQKKEKEKRRKRIKIRRKLEGSFKPWREFQVLRPQISNTHQRGSSTGDNVGLFFHLNETAQGILPMRCT